MTRITRRGLFIGLVTLDLIYLVEQLPCTNQKIVALDYTMAAGGPATNAAVTFQYLGQLESTQPDLAQPWENQATVLGVIGSHPISRSIAAELERWGVAIADLAPEQTEPIPTSAILVTQKTGERSVVSLNAVRSQAAIAAIPCNILQHTNIVLVDGHQMAVSEAIARQSRAQDIPVVVDAGSWKPGFEAILAHATHVICSANFHPPGCESIVAVLNYVQQFGVSHVAVTGGDKAIQVWSQGKRLQIAVPQIQPVDTLGAGDILHGAFCHFILQHEFAIALEKAAQVASHSCESFGTRSWMSAQ